MGVAGTFFKKKGVPTIRTGIALSGTSIFMSVLIDFRCGVFEDLWAMRLMVCPRLKVPSFAEAPVTHFVSLIDPDEANTIVQPPNNARERLRLVFHDLDDIEMSLPRYAKYEAPTEEHVAALVKFGRNMAPLDDWGLLTHCEAGISRSSAAAITMLVAAGYAPQVAFGLVRRACPLMLPNRRMLRIADGLLDTGGRLHNMAQIYRRKAFLRAGYEDPTNVLLAEVTAAKSKRMSFLERLMGFLNPGWRRRVGTGATMRGIDLQQVAKDRGSANRRKFTY